MHIPTLCGSERALVVSTEPPDEFSCLTTPGVGRPGDGAVARAVDQVHPDAHPRGGGGDAVPRDVPSMAESYHRDLSSAGPMP